MAKKEHVPFLVFKKKGICKHADKERVRSKALDNLRKVIATVCADWGVETVDSGFCPNNAKNRSFWGRYTWNNSINYHKIKINSASFWRTNDKTSEFFEREELVDTIFHELAHYIENMMFGDTDHTSRFHEVFDAIKAKKDEYLSVCEKAYC